MVGREEEDMQGKGEDREYRMQGKQGERREFRIREYRRRFEGQKLL